jgi:hypothetical protein
MAFASMYFTYPGVSEATLRKASACVTSPCSALLEGAGASRQFRAYAATSNLALIEELIKTNHCEGPLLTRFAKGRELPAGEALQVLADDVEQVIPKMFGN